MWSIPLLRRGKAYHSLDLAPVQSCLSGEVLGEVGQANPALISHDLNKEKEARGVLNEHSVSQLLHIVKKAGEIFEGQDVHIDGRSQSPGEYVHLLSHTSGLPHSLCHSNMEKISQACARMETTLAGFTRDLDRAVLDAGLLQESTRLLSYRPATNSLGVILPSNSPGVNTLWLPAIALKTPVILKPGAFDPWTPLRLAYAFMQAGCPPQAFSYYPTSHDGATRILEACDRNLLFGGGATTAPWQTHSSVQIHTQGRSKVLIAEDMAARWEVFLDSAQRSVLDNGGRSCINASTFILSAHAREFGEALAARLGPIRPLPPEDPEAILAAFPDRQVAEKIDASIQSALLSGSACDLTQPFRDGPRITEFKGALYLRPTLLLCDGLDAPLANTEFPFPFAAIVQMPIQQALDEIGPTLTATLLSEDEELVRLALGSAHIDRVNLGNIPTSQIRWDQPHEGNLFDLLYQRRAIQVA